MLYGTSFVAARYAGIRDFLHAAIPADAVHTTPNGCAAGKPSPSEQCTWALPLSAGKEKGVLKMERMQQAACLSGVHNLQ
jgi:hypothetical protein